MKVVRTHPDADREIVEAFDWYEQKRTKLGAEFLAEINLAISRIRENPYRYALEDSVGRRHSSVDRLPYIIVYIDMPDYIWIAAFSHVRRRRGYWKKRLPEENGSHG